MLRRIPRYTSVVQAHPFRDRFSRWQIVIKMYDGRACPECGAVVCHWFNRNTHKEHHQRQAEFEQALHLLNDTVFGIARSLNLPVRSAGPDDEPGGSDDDEEDGYDDRLTRHARRAAQGTVYLDDERWADG